MRRHLLPITVCIALLAIAGGGCGSTDCEFTATCTSGAASSGGGDGGPNTVEPPPGCNPKADAKEALACQSDDYAMFVDATNGNDANPGTKGSPKKTIKNAIEKANGKPRIYICDGTYDERVTLTTATSLIGGFACTSWGYTGTKARIAPTATGVAVHVIGLANEISISDLEIRAAPGVNPSDSS